MYALSQLRSWTQRLLFAGSLALGCGNPTPIYHEEPTCMTSPCEEEPPEESVPAEPEKFCPEGKEGDAYWKLPDGTLGELTENCAEDQICIGGLCAKLGTFAFVSDRSGETEIYLQEGFLASLQLSDTIPGVSPQSPDFSPNGECVVFELMKGYYSSLHILCLDGTTYQLTSTPGYTSHPSYDPTGEEVIFSSTMSGTWNLYARRVQGTDLNDLFQLTSLPHHNYEVMTENGRSYATAFLDPDRCRNGDWIVFRCDYRRNIDGNNFSENSEICKMRPDGSEFTRLTFSEHEADYAPACSPDGTKIAFTSSRYDAELGFGNDDPYVMDIDGQNERRITNEAGPQTTPAWSADGKLIGYETGTGYERNLWITDNLGKEHLPLTSDQGDEFDVVFKE